MRIMTRKQLKEAISKHYGNMVGQFISEDFAVKSVWEAYIIWQEGWLIEQESFEVLAKEVYQAKFKGDKK